MELQNKLSSALQDSESHSQRIAAQETQLEGLMMLFLLIWKLEFRMCFW